MSSVLQRLERVHHVSNETTTIACIGCGRGATIPKDWDHSKTGPYCAGWVCGHCAHAYRIAPIVDAKDPVQRIAAALERIAKNTDPQTALDPDIQKKLRAVFLEVAKDV